MSCLQSSVLFLKGSDAQIHLATSCHKSSMASSRQMEEPLKQPSGNFSKHMVGLKNKNKLLLHVRVNIRKRITCFAEANTKRSKKGEGSKEKERICATEEVWRLCCTARFV